MRTVLTILLAFAAGILLMLWLPDRPHTTNLAAPAVATVPVASATVLPQASSVVANDNAQADDDWPGAGPTPEQVMYAQPRMVRSALSQLTPRVSGKPNLYLLAFAGDGSEDVFRNEAEYAAQMFSRRFGATAHALVLENNPATLATRPLADWSNLDAALGGLDKIMQPDQDILLLYVTRHGSEDHTLLVDMDPLPLDQIGAQDLAGILSMHRFKWKVLVINACYSGGYFSRALQCRLVRGTRLRAPAARPRLPGAHRRPQRPQFIRLRQRIGYHLLRPRVAGRRPEPHRQLRRRLQAGPRRNRQVGAAGQTDPVRAADRYRQRHRGSAGAVAPWNQDRACRAIQTGGARDSRVRALTGRCATGNRPVHQ